MLKIQIPRFLSQRLQFTSLWDKSSKSEGFFKIHPSFYCYEWSTDYTLRNNIHFLLKGTSPNDIKVFLKYTLIILSKRTAVPIKGNSTHFNSLKMETLDSVMISGNYIKHPFASTFSTREVGKITRRQTILK